MTEYFFGKELKWYAKEMAQVFSDCLPKPGHECFVSSFENIKNIFFRTVMDITQKLLEVKPSSLLNRAAGKSPTPQLDPEICKVRALPVSLWRQVRIKSYGFSILLRTSS
jgi:hypothetical protein